MDGWHHTFKMAQDIDSLHLKMPKVKKVLVDQRMLPTGGYESFSSFRDFEKIGNKQFDTCFHIMDENQKTTIELPNPD